MARFKELLARKQIETSRNKIAQSTAVPMIRTIEGEGTGCGELDSTVSTAAYCGTC